MKPFEWGGSAVAGGSSDAALVELEDFRRLTAATRHVSGLLDAAVLAHRAAREARSLLGTDLAAVAIREHPGLLVIEGTSGARTKEFPGLHVPSGAGIGGKILVAGKPVSVADYEHDPSITRDFVDIVVKGEGVGGMAGVPVTYEGQIVGVLYAGIRYVGALADRAQSMMLEFARSLGPLVGGAIQSENRVRQSVQEERQRLALQMHDSIGQLLFTIGASARRAQGQVPARALTLVQQLKDIEVQASRAGSYLRDALRALGPAPDEAVPAVVQMDAHSFTHRTNVPVYLVALGQPFDLPAEVESVLLLAVREGLHNVEKHALASSAVLTLHYGESDVEVVVQDDGRGLPADFEPPQVPKSGQGWGLPSLRQRVEALGGTMALVPNEDAGVTLRVVIPVDRRDG